MQTRCSFNNVGFYVARVLDVQIIIKRDIDLQTIGRKIVNLNVRNFIMLSDSTTIDDCTTLEYVVTKLLDLMLQNRLELVKLTCLNCDSRLEKNFIKVLLGIKVIKIRRYV